MNQSVNTKVNRAICAKGWMSEMEDTAVRFKRVVRISDEQLTAPEGVAIPTPKDPSINTQVDRAVSMRGCMCEMLGTPVRFKRVVRIYQGFLCTV